MNNLNKDITLEQWDASRLSFLSQYLFSRFGDRYHFNPESSVRLLRKHLTSPVSLVVYVDTGSEDIVNLPHDDKLTITSSGTMHQNISKHHGINIITLEEAVARLQPKSYKNMYVEVASSIYESNFDYLSKALMELKNLASINRIIGAYEAMDMKAESAKLKIIMDAVFPDVKPLNPFV